MVKKIIILVLSILALAPSAQAAELEVSGWIPYWSASGGTRDARRSLSDLSEINPFVYSLQPSGEIRDLGNLSARTWKNLFTAARKQNVEIVPTIMSSSGSGVHALLSDPVRRAAHVQEIASLVRRQKFDGIDIDYEGKLGATRPFFSLFLLELKVALGEKLLSCTIEARTPPDSLYRTLPTNLEYANDFPTLAAACDRVKIMTYDQQRADWKLNTANSDEPYIPVSDPSWVEKVIQLTTKTIPAEKIMLGIPTYGHEYEVTETPDGTRRYVRMRAINAPAAERLAKKERAKTYRAASGEIAFRYDDVVLIPGTETYRYVTWSDGQAIADKITLAKKYNLAGVAFFKIDGDQDDDLWDNL